MRFIPRGGFFHGFVDGGITAEKFFRQTDFARFRGNGKLRERWRARARKRGGIVRARRGEHVVKSGNVGNATRHRSDLFERGRKRHRSVAGNGSVSRFEADNAAKTRRLADRPARVRAERERRHSRRYRRRRTAGRAAGNAIGVPRIGGFRESGIFRRGAHRKFVHIETPENDGTGFFQIGNDGRIVGRNKIFEHFRRAGTFLPGNGDIVFDGDGNAVERAECRSRSTAGVGGVGLRERVGFVHGKKRADFSVRCANAVELRLHEFARGDFFLRKKRCKFSCRFKI